MIEVICGCVHLTDTCRAWYEDLVSGNIEADRAWARNVCKIVAFPDCEYCKGTGIIKLAESPREVTE